MRTILISILAIIPMLVSCRKQKQAATLPEIFIESLRKQKFELLEPYFATIEFHKSLEKNPTPQNDTAALNFVETSNKKLKESWTSISERIKANKIDLSKLKIIESISAQPFWTKKISRMVVVYSYENKNWDDIVFIVGESNDKNLLIEIPEPDKVFSMTDTTLNASNDARFENEIRSPEFKKTLQNRVDTIILYAKQNKVKEFSEFISFPGDDETSSKSDTASIYGSRNQIAAGLMEKINNIMKDCDKPAYGDINSLEQWIVIQLRCSNKFVHFAFIRSNNKFLLNDVDGAGLN